MENPCGNADRQRVTIPIAKRMRKEKRKVHIMRNIHEVMANCLNKLDAIGIEYGRIVSVSINTRAKRRWGQCKQVNGRYEISISSRLMSEDVALIHLETTVIHEILHTCKGCMNHGMTWKNLAEKVNRAYGYNIKRTTSSEEKGIEEIPVVRKIKHKFVCMNCGQVITRQRESDFTRFYAFYSCGICKGKFEKVF